MWPRDWSSDVCSSDLAPDENGLGTQVDGGPGEGSLGHGQHRGLVASRTRGPRRLGGRTPARGGASRGTGLLEIGRASCRARGAMAEAGVVVESAVGAV